MLGHKSQVTTVFVMLMALTFIFSIFILHTLSNLTKIKIIDEMLFEMEVGNKGKQILSFLSVSPDGNERMIEILGYLFVSDKEEIEKKIKNIKHVLKQFGNSYFINVTDGSNSKFWLGKSSDIKFSANIPIPGALKGNLKGVVVLGR